MQRNSKSVRRRKKLDSLAPVFGGVFLVARRLEHYVLLSDWDIWGKGWARRAGRLLVGAEAYGNLRG